MLTTKNGPAAHSRLDESCRDGLPSLPPKPVSTHVSEVHDIYILSHTLPAPSLSAVDDQSTNTRIPHRTPGQPPHLQQFAWGASRPRPELARPSGATRACQHTISRTRRGSARDATRWACWSGPHGRAHAHMQGSGDCMNVLDDPFRHRQAWLEEGGHGRRKRNYRREGWAMGDEGWCVSSSAPPSAVGNLRL